MEQSNPSSSRSDRKTIERNRRNHMKALYSELNSLVPHQTSRETSLPEQLDEATSYIKKLQTNLERMKEKKDGLMGMERPNGSSSSSSNSGVMAMGIRSAQIEIHQNGAALEVVLITGLDCQFMFNETIRVLHEEGAEIVSASFTVVEDTVFHTIHSKVEEPALGDEATARISERVNKLFVRDGC